MGQPENISHSEQTRGAAGASGEGVHKNIAMWIGFAVTLAVAVTFVCGLGERLELMCLSFRQSIAAKSMPPGDIICVDIDDSTIAKVGRWPWPREILAGSVDVLKLCGAKTAAFDLILPDPQILRYDAPSGWLYEADDSQGVFNTAPVPMFDDMLFARAIKSADNVFLPLHLDDLGEIKKEQLDLAKKLDDICEKSSSPLSFAEVRKLLPAADDELLKRVWLRKMALKYCSPFELNYLAPKIDKLNYHVESGYLQPPLVSLAAAMHGTGFVTFTSDIDGVVRCLSMLAKDEKKIFPQFALAIAACDIGNCQMKDISFKCGDGQITFTAPNGMGRTIPLDPRGRMLIRYSSQTWMQGGGPNHIPMSSVVFVWQEMQRLKDLDQARRELQLKFVSIGFGEDVGFENEVKALESLTLKRNLLFERETAARRAVYRNELFGGQDGEKLAQNLSEAAAALDEVDRQTLEITSVMVNKISADENLLTTFAADRISEAKDKLAILKALPALRKQQEQRVKKSQAELAERVKGRICLIGSISTGAADFVPTPLGQRTPGMVVHANIINTIQQDLFLRQAPWWISFAMMIFCGGLTSMAAARQGILTALLVTFTFAVAYTVFNVYSVFVQMGVWLDLVGPLAAMAISFLAVTIYRELTEEHAKRKIKAMFSHALSPELVEQLIADPSIAQLGGQNRRITCLFSDLASFTPLSGRLGARDTVKLLNRYFDCVTEIVQKRWGGYINKFLGDGVFAIFGAPVWQENHVSRCLRAAVEYSAAVADLNSSLQEEGFDDAALGVRIGLTTDEAMVGNCGSSQRMDYTAIGSTVNLASRLQSAGKFFGTSILAERKVIDAGAEADVIARCMGMVMITGVETPVEVWNVMGRRGELPEAAQQAAETFNRAVELVRKREFSAAAELFIQVREMLGGADKPAEIFLEICKNALNSGNPAEYQPAEVNADAVVRMII